MKLYIYNPETMEVLATVERDTNEECEAVADANYDTNDVAWTYSPAFGMVDGLIDTEDAEEL